MKNENYEFGCVMLYFDNPQLGQLESIINKDDLHEKGFEDEPHITLLYGIHDEEVSDNEVFDVVSRNLIPKKLLLENVSLFENDGYDVLKFDVKEDILSDINAELRLELPYTSDYPDYNAHSTIAYLKKGSGKKYVDAMKDLTLVIEPREVIYSKSNGDKISSKTKLYHYIIEDSIDSLTRFYIRATKKT